jgi:hypothetical protein
MRTWKLVACSLAIGCTGLSALAQDGKPKGAGADQPPPPRANDGAPRGQGGGRGPALSPEATKAAWELQAKGVATRLALNDEQTKALVTAYMNARESHTAASDKMRQEMMDKMAAGGGNQDGARGAGREAMKAMQDMQKAEAEKFKAALGSALSPEQTEKVMGSLGSFNRQWDMFADRVAALKLDPAKQNEALNAVEDFMAAQTKARAGMGGENFDRDAMQKAMQDARQSFLDTMKKTLSPEQYTKFEESMPMGGGRQRGGGPV